MISVFELTKKYGKITAVEDLTFQISRGEVIGFIGPNGAGKTTAFKCLTTLLCPDKGDVSFDGINLKENPEKVRNLIGFLPEGAPLIVELTVKEYLNFRFALKSGCHTSCVNVEEASSVCGLTQVKNRVIGTLSEGYRKRTALAETLLGDPKILILDEPANGLDPEQIIHLRNLFLSLKSTHTLLISSHILSELEMICDRFIILSKGRIKSIGSREELLSRSSRKNKVLLRILEKNETFMQRLQNVAGIEKVVLNNQNEWRFELTIQDKSDPVPEIGRLIKQMDLTILELIQVTPSLEELYMELTHEENAVNRPD
ncbi:MAG: ABC transporter ATP-binding protein [Candidatus Aureabacteria bacterium]|nr:ABC transporter ATP-binding protein [Candidatus Auribacterota bacterium]